MTTTTADALRAWAKGIYPSEAGVELLIRSGRAVYDGAPWITRDGDIAWIDVDELLRETGAWSGGEQRLVRIAASGCDSLVRPRCDGLIWPRVRYAGVLTV
ncbi:hypothetical protein [Propionibacterium freudenreichii]|uniref:hypothetical protein n=1 Tax=Propionibacterium freudenreichii TaxID=1744 RepID=UPI002549EC2D|nr:hypothetical protein [Propionibacterium freudenreichii]